MDNPIIRAYACLSIPWRQVRLTKQKTAQKAKEEKMWGWIGMITFMFGIILIITIHKDDFGTVFLALITAFGFVIAISSHGVEGDPKTSIETGDYSIVSYAETMSGDKSMYQMILKQNNKMEFYALPKNMVTIDKTNGKTGTLEVIEKAGSKKAIMRP